MKTNSASLNSEGLPNYGINYYLSKETIDESMGVPAVKPLIVSISGKNLEDNITMLKTILSSDEKIDAIELNLACPNVIGKPIIAYDFDQMRTVLEAVSKVQGIDKTPLGVKMPPYFDGPHFERAAAVLNEHKSVVRYVASINTIGNALAIDVVSESPVISSNQGFAGLSGRAVKFTALANVRKMRTLLDPSIDVVGVGGIESGSDAFEMILCGATAVQVGTCHWKEGPKCFDRICSELETLMQSKGYQTIDDFRNKLKPWSKEGAALSRAAAKKTPSAVKDPLQTSSDGSSKLGLLCSILVALVAMLLADKLGIVTI